MHCCRDACETRNVFMEDYGGIFIDADTGRFVDGGAGILFINDEVSTFIDGDAGTFINDAPDVFIGVEVTTSVEPDAGTVVNTDNVLSTTGDKYSVIISS